MNLFNYHTDPESLKHYEAAHEKIPRFAWEKYAGDASQIRAREHLWAREADKSVMYAMHFLGERFKKGEPAILKDSFWARVYASEVIKGPWPEAEDIIATSAYDSFVYAQQVLKARFKKGEDAIRHSQYNNAYVSWLLRPRK